MYQFQNKHTKQPHFNPMDHKKQKNTLYSCPCRVLLFSFSYFRENITLIKIALTITLEHKSNY